MTANLEKQTEHSTVKASEGRNYGIDLLRILLMFLIVLRHGSYQSDVISVANVPEINYLIGVGINGFTGIAVNCFILISGYYLCTQRFRLGRIINLYIITLSYSLFVTLIMLLHPGFHCSWMSLLRAIFPVCTGFSWFMSLYFVIALLSPYMNGCLCNLTQKQFLWLLGILLFFFSLVPSFGLSTFSQVGGYTLTWFIVLYCAGAYWRFYRNHSSVRKDFILFLASCLLIFAFLALKFFLKRKGITLVHPDNYDFLPTFFASFFCFRLFLNIKVPVCLNPCLARISPLMLGVYLFHDNRLKHELWKNVLEINKHVHDNLWFVHMIACICVVFLAGCLFEWLRQRLFHLLSGFFANCIRKKSSTSTVPDKKP